MQVKNVEKKEKSTVSFDVVCEAAEFEAAVQKTYLKNKSKIFVPGFRKGKAPRTVVEGMYGKDVFYEDAADEIAPEAFRFGADGEKLRTVGNPAIKDINIAEDKTLTLSFLTAVWPEVTLGQYKGVEAPRAAEEVTDAQIDADIERTRKRNERVEDVERPAANGDTAVIDYVGTVDGVPFDGGSAEAYSLVLGSGSFIPGFEEQVVGMSAGEERDIQVTFPEEYHAEELKGKAAVFHVKCNQVREHQLPELDDEFIKDISTEFDTVAAYREDVKKRLTARAEENADGNFHEALLQKAVQNMTAEIPDAMVEEELDRIMNEMNQTLTMQGLSLEMYLQYLNVDFATFRDQSRAAAENRSKVKVLLDAIATAEGFTFTEEEYEAEYASIAEDYMTDVETVKNALDRDAITGDLRAKKASELINSTGVAVAPEAEPAAETEEKPKAKMPAAKKTAAKKPAAAAEEGAEPAAEEKPKAKKTAAKKTEAEPAAPAED